MVGSIDLSPYGIDSLCCLKRCQNSLRSWEKLLININCIPKFFLFYVFNVLSQKYNFAYKNIQLLYLILPKFQIKIFKKQNMNQFSQLCNMFTCWPLEAKLVQRKTAFDQQTHNYRILSSIIWKLSLWHFSDSTCKLQCQQYYAIFISTEVSRWIGCTFGETRLLCQVSVSVSRLHRNILKWRGAYVCYDKTLG